MNFSKIFQVMITVLGLTAVTALAEFDFNVDYAEFVNANPDTIFLESDIGLHTGYTENGQRQIITIPHNSVLAISSREYNGYSGYGTETYIPTTAPKISGAPIATLVKLRNSGPILLSEVCMEGT